MKSATLSISSTSSSSTTSTMRERRKAVFYLQDDEDSEDEATYTVTRKSARPENCLSTMRPGLTVDVVSANGSGLKKSKKVLDLGDLVREIPAM